MRVMFAVSDLLPHYYPMVPLGWALQAAGHEVRVVCAPAQRPQIESAGLTPVPILEDVDLLMWARIGHHAAARAGAVPADLRLPPMNPQTGAVLDRLDDFDDEAFMSTIRGPEASKAGRRIDAMVDFARRWGPDLVVHDLLHLDAVVAARAVGVPAVCHLTGPIGTAETEWGLDFIPAHYSRAYDRHGVTDRGTALISHVVDICPPSMAPATHGPASVLPVRYVPYNGPGAAPEWAARRARYPRVVVMWSNTLEHLFGPASFAVPAILDALSGLDVEAVVTASAAAIERIGPVGDRVRLLEHCPLHPLLAAADVLIHSGGAGSTLTAAANGVPGLAIAFGAEYRANGRRLAATGAGLVLDGPDIGSDLGPDIGSDLGPDIGSDLGPDSGSDTGPELIRAAVRTLLDDGSYRDAAARLRDEIEARPSPAALAAALVSLAASGSDLVETGASAPVGAGARP